MTDKGLDPQGFIQRHPQVSYVGILVESRTQAVDPSRRHDDGFQLRVPAT